MRQFRTLPHPRATGHGRTWEYVPSEARTPTERLLPTMSVKIDLLFVDDDDDFRTLAARRFQREGYLVAEASDGERALELARRRH